LGPNCTQRAAPSTAAAIASTRAICSATLHRGEKLRLDHRPRVGGQLRQDALIAAVDHRVAIAHEHGERDAHADIRGRTGDFARFLDRRHGPVKARIVRHHRARASPRRSSQGGERAEIGIDRRHRGQAQKPGLERLASRAKGRWRQRARMVMRVDERGQSEAPSLRRARSRDDRRDDAVLDDEVHRRPG
jgi:hypothetical protein